MPIFASISQMIGCRDWLQNDVNCGRWGVLNCLSNLLAN